MSFTGNDDWYSNRKKKRDTTDFVGYHDINSIKAWIKNPVEAVNRPANKRIIQQIISGGYGDSWSGGSWDDTVRQITSGVDNFPEWIKGIEKVLELPTVSYRRKRVYSDVAGEIDFDRRWTDTPFETFKRQRQSDPIVNLNVWISFSGWVSAETIRNYGMRIYRIIHTLEMAGKNVCLSIYSPGQNEWATARNKTTNHIIKIKNTNEYIQPQTVAAAFTSCFYRKIIFATYVIDADKFGHDCSSGLGGPISMKGELLTIEGNNVWLEVEDPVMFDGDAFDKGLTRIFTELVTNQQTTI